MKNRFVICVLTLFASFPFHQSQAHGWVDSAKAGVDYTIVDHRRQYCYQPLSPDYTAPGFAIPEGDIRAGLYTLYPATTRCLDLGFSIYTGYLFGTQLQTRTYAKTTESGLLLCEQGMIEFCALRRVTPVGTVTVVSQAAGRCYETFLERDLPSLPAALGFQVRNDSASCVSLGMPILAGYLVGSRQRVPVFANSEATAVDLCNSRTADPCAVLSNEGIRNAVVRVEEFYNARLDRYFRTADGAEAAFLSSTPATGEVGTGDTFFAFSVAIAGTKPVCRFYGSVTPGPNSHFFTADEGECSRLRQIQSTTPASQPRWNFEAISFYVYMPVAGACPPVAPKPIYRAYNRGSAVGKDSNHRFTSRLSAYNEMIGKGWMGEGVVMCAQE